MPRKRTRSLEVRLAEKQAEAEKLKVQKQIRDLQDRKRAMTGPRR